MRVALMTGSGASGHLPASDFQSHRVETPYGNPSAAVRHWVRGGVELFAIPRHGDTGSIPPHWVNYRANIWALAQYAPDFLLGINAVGGIHAEATPGRLVLPTQLIDYTWGREHSFEDAANQPVQHVDFTHPFTPAVHARLAGLSRELGLQALERGVYGVTQGPRLESAAEIDRLERDGCDVVGMTAMPEAGLAREIGLDYAICAVVVNHAAGRGPEDVGIHAQIARNLSAGAAAVEALLGGLIRAA
jgi:5'-methylthioinosine phosphorylase